MENLKALAASWARSFLAAGIAVYMAGVSDPKAIGMAGLAAAKTLVASGFEVVVLEARTRLGGRIATSTQRACSASYIACSTRTASVTATRSRKRKV